MKITITRQIAADEFAEVFPYTARVEIISATKDPGAVYEVPILVRHHGIQKSFQVEIFGFRLDAKKPDELRPKMEHILRGLINAARFPTYVFIARRAKAIFPVYTIGDEVVALTNEGPVFRHVELAKVRRYLTDFLHDAKILGEEGKSDKLHVRGISRHTLGLRRPVMYLKKRALQGEDFWAPVFQSSNGRSIYAYAASERQEINRGDQEVLTLHKLVANGLQQDKRLTDLYHLRPDRLMPSYWERLKKTSDFLEDTTVGNSSFPLYKNGNVYFAVEKRLEEERFGLFIGESKTAIVEHVTADLKRRGLL
ncbi:MAG: hypothetical protein AAF490_20395 [Chloroflexota bacterium]